MCKHVRISDWYCYMLNRRTTRFRRRDDTINPIGADKGTPLDTTHIHDPVVASKYTSIA